MHEDDHCMCFGCFVRRAFGAGQKTPSFQIEAYKLFIDVATHTVIQKSLAAGGFKQDCMLTCKEVLDMLPVAGHHMMGDLASVVFDVLELRHSRDLHRISEELISVHLIPKHGDKERFTDYDIDLLKALREFEPKGQPP